MTCVRYPGFVVSDGIIKGTWPVKGTIATMIEDMIYVLVDLA